MATVLKVLTLGHIINPKECAVVRKSFRGQTVAPQNSQAQNERELEEECKPYEQVLVLLPPRGKRPERVDPFEPSPSTRENHLVGRFVYEGDTPVLTMR